MQVAPSGRLRARRPAESLVVSGKEHHSGSDTHERRARLAWGWYSEMRETWHYRLGARSVSS
jgi:hypothetical protein